MFLKNIGKKGKLQVLSWTSMCHCLSYYKRMILQVTWWKLPLALGVGPVTNTLTPKKRRKD